MTEPLRQLEITVHELIVTAAMLAGFGIVAVMFRVEREVTLQEKRPELKSRLALADWILFPSVLLALAVVIVLLIWIPGPYAERAWAFAVAACAAAAVLQFGYIPSILAHYGISIGERSRVETREAAQPTEDWMVPLSAFAAAGLFGWLLCHNLCR